VSVYSAVKYGGFTLVLNVFPFSCKGYSSIVLKFTPFLMCTVGYCTVLLLSLLYSFHVCIGLAGCSKTTTVLQIHEVGCTVLVVHARIL
jgi:hypothetical protein